MKKLAVIIMSLATISILLVSGARSASAAPTSSGDGDKPIKIGLVVPLTGPLSFGGTETKNAAELAIKKKGTLLGRPVELVAADAPTEDAFATEVARLVSLEDVKFFTTGYVYNEPSNQAVIERNGGFLVDCLGWNPDLVADDSHPDYFLFTPTTDSFCGEHAQYTVRFGREFLGKEPENLRVGLISCSSFQYISEACKDFLLDLGVKPIVSDVYDDNISDFTPIIQKLKAAELDIVIPTQLDVDAEKFIKACVSLGYKPPIIFGTGLGFDGTAMQEFGEGVVGLMSISYANPGMNEAAATGLAEFKQTYNATYNRYPLTHALNEYTGMSILLNAIESAGSLEFDKVRAAMIAMDVPAGGTPSYWGVKFNPERHFNERATPLVVGQWFAGENGKNAYKVVFPDNLAVDKPIIPFNPPQ
jgi:branched-chain amino acid transport system substrate-binding protein